MKKSLAIILVVIMLTMLLSVTAFAASANTVKYYDADGNQITVSGMYYDDNNNPMFNSRCYYTDANGQAVYVGGCRAYFYDANGNLVPGTCYYDANGNIIQPPSNSSGYRGGGCGCGGRW